MAVEEASGTTSTRDRDGIRDDGRDDGNRGGRSGRMAGFRREGVTSPTVVSLFSESLSMGTDVAGAREGGGICRISVADWVRILSGISHIIGARKGAGTCTVPSPGSTAFESKAPRGWGTGGQWAGNSIISARGFSEEGERQASTSAKAVSILSTSTG